MKVCVGFFNKSPFPFFPQSNKKGEPDPNTAGSDREGGSIEQSHTRGETDGRASTGTGGPDRARVPSSNCNT